MSVSVELQKLIYARLVADAGVHAICEDRVYDRPPKDAVFPYVNFGPFDFVPEDAECIYGGTETRQINCWSRYAGGKIEATALADAVRKALHEYKGELAVNALVEMICVGSRVFDDPDGITTHGVVSIQSTVEEP